jgi:hypothetical protein
MCMYDDNREGMMITERVESTRLQGKNKPPSEGEREPGEQARREGARLKQEGQCMLCTFI